MNDADQIFAGMGSLFTLMAISSIVGLALAAGVGYWCMKVLESKGKSRGIAFLIGFALTFFFSVAGAVAALLIAYLWDSVVPANESQAAATRLPPPPPPVSPEALTVATFTSATGWSGRRILYDRGALQLEGLCTLRPADVLGYARRGQLYWTSDAMRDWIADWAARA